jgi:lipopolysaccharide transport system permease protein
MPPVRILLLPLFLLLCLLLALGSGLVLASYNIKYRDMAQIVPIIVQIGQYVSPVGYSTSIIPEKWLLLYSLNPLVGIIDSFRWCILGGAEYSMASIVISVVWTIILLLWGVTRFRRVERTFADIV